MSSVRLRFLENGDRDNSFLCRGDELGLRKCRACGKHPISPAILMASNSATAITTSAAVNAALTAAKARNILYIIYIII